MSQSGTRECARVIGHWSRFARWRIPFVRSFVMFNRRVLLSALLATGLVAGGVAVAKTHQHHDAHALLGAKLKENGKHQIHKLGNNPVTAEVSNNKVVNMTARNLPVRKVRSTNKMA